MTTTQCENSRKNSPDPKELMAQLLIQHNLLHGKDWENFHKDLQKLVNKYHPLYEKGFQD